MRLTLLASLAAAAAEPEAPGPDEIAGWLDAVVVVVTGPSLCAGALIDEAGTVATAYHCVSSGRRPELETRDGVKVVGRILATDAKADLALVSAPELAGRPWLEIREDAPRPGEPVWALGHPFGTESERSEIFAGLLRWSVTQGIVSAVGERLIQVDAPMNPGNSGGPIVDAAGQIVGVASRKLSGDNLGFIARSDDLIALIEDPERRRVPLALGLGLSATLPASPGLASGLGAYGELVARDTAVLRLGAAYSPELRWVALSRGEVLWPAATASLSGRARVGRGTWSTYLDVGGGAVLYGGRTAVIEEGSIRLLETAPELAPMGVVRLGFGGAAVRWMGSPDPDGGIRLMVAVDVDWPGTLVVL